MIKQNDDCNGSNEWAKKAAENEKTEGKERGGTEEIDGDASQDENGSETESAKDSDESIVTVIRIRREDEDSQWEGISEVSSAISFETSDRSSGKWSTDAMIEFPLSNTDDMHGWKSEIDNEWANETIEKSANDSNFEWAQKAKNDLDEGKKTEEIDKGVSIMEDDGWKEEFPWDTEDMEYARKLWTGDGWKEEREPWKAAENQRYKEEAAEIKKRFRELLEKAPLTPSEISIVQNFGDHPKLMLTILSMRRQLEDTQKVWTIRRCGLCEELVGNVPLRPHRANECPIQYQDRIVYISRTYGRRKCICCGKLKANTHSCDAPKRCYECEKYKNLVNIEHAPWTGYCQYRNRFPSLDFEQMMKRAEERNDEKARVVMDELSRTKSDPRIMRQLAKRGNELAQYEEKNENEVEKATMYEMAPEECDGESDVSLAETTFSEAVRLGSMKPLQ